MDTTRAPDADDATPGLLSSAVGDRCSNCGAPLASDQRYCVNCGTRRGKPRFTFDQGAANAAARQPAASPPKKRSRQPTSATLVIGFIGVLLLAMGVGVLIGHNGNSSSPQAAVNQKPLVVTVGGGGAVASTPTTSTPANTSSKSGAGKSKSKNGAKSVSGNNANGNGAAAAKHIDKKTAAAAATAAQKALGSSQAVSNPTVQPGQKATGPGTQNGKFTGAFFPGGQ